MDKVIGWMFSTLLWMALGAYVFTCGYAVYAYVQDERMMRRRRKARVRR